MFTQSEFDAVKSYLADGRSVMLLLNDAVTDSQCKNLNYFLEDFGIGVTPTPVMRAVF